MDDLVLNIFLEVGFFALLGLIYYFYQKRKILHYEAHKEPLILGALLESCLAEKDRGQEGAIDAVIEALDDYLQQKSPGPPTALLRQFAEGPECGVELRALILASLEELAETPRGKN